MKPWQPLLGANNTEGMYTVEPPCHAVFDEMELSSLNHHLMVRIRHLEIKSLNTCL